MNALARRLKFYRRIVDAYLLPGRSQLTFWHDVPSANTRSGFASLGEYYMNFARKAAYGGPFDASGVPMLDYRGAIGIQYNPIAIAQWGLGNHDLFIQSGDASSRQKMLLAADWLANNLQPNSSGVPVWQHHFDWEYRSTLRAPWYSGLAQGQGISLLLRANAVTADLRYLDAAHQAFISLTLPVSQGGVQFTDVNGDCWIEEYIVDPPTHILNGFIWAAWGVYDMALVTRSPATHELFEKLVRTLVHNLNRFDLGFWSLYELSGTRLPMVASPFYHRLHIVQLEIMAKMTGDSLFQKFAQRWRAYSERPSFRLRAVCYKSAFKLCYY